MAISLATACVLFGNLRFRSNVLAVGFEDDFFYYAQIGRNLAFHGISSFDGIHLTNGYHPLWLLIIAGLTKLFAPAGLLAAKSLLPFVLALETVQFMLVLAIAWFTYLLAQRYCSQEISICILLLQTAFSLVLVRTGMEVGLALAAIFALLWFRLRPSFRWSSNTCFFLGCLSSFCILSRLDVFLLIALLFSLDRSWRIARLRSLLMRAASFTAGLLPVIVYIQTNRTYFGTLTPISGMAKQLRSHYIPSQSGLLSFAGFFTASSSPLLLPALISIFAALVLVSLQRQRFSRERHVLIAVLAFPFLHLLTVVTLSDWKLWPWYLYPWVPAGVFAGVVFFQSSEKDQFRDSWIHHTAVVFSAVFLLLYAGAITISSNPTHNLTYMAGLDLKAFSAQHPGVYAMGDRSGAPGFLIDQPIIQLEGLTMDRAYLENIRQERPLISVLKQYGVRYYVSTRGTQENNCFAFKEPWQAGPDSPSMRGSICVPPLATFQHATFVNRVFDIQGL